VPLTSFTEHQLCCQFDRRYWMDIRGLGLPPVGYELGGASGGPMLQPVFKDGEWDWRLVGVISEGVMAEDFERITAVRAHFILPDGRGGAGVIAIDDNPARHDLSRVIPRPISPVISRAKGNGACKARP
jgi:hypothetical protein